MELLDSSEILIFLIIIGLVLIVAIFFLLAQQNTLKAIRPENRSMSPGEVWLQLIPLFNLVWQFIVVNRIAQSIQKELSSDNRFSFEQQDHNSMVYSSQEKPTYNVGLSMCILNVCGLIPVLGSFASFAALICFIVYWVQLSNSKNQILAKNYTITE
jgi:hypothetical protein